MNSPSNAVPDPAAEMRAAAPAAMALTRPLYWSIRRELWEYRSIYVVPLAVAGVALLGYMIRAVTLPHRIAGLDPMKQRDVIEQPYHFSAGLIMGIAFIVGIYYCADALYGERRDRSILFWKSLPVSDLTTVLAKASVPLVILPGFATVVFYFTEWVMLLFGSAVLAASHSSASALWTPSTLFQMQVRMLYHIVTVHVIWYAPIYCWFLLASAWAKRAPFLWAVLPPVLIGGAEKLVFNTTHFANWIFYRLSGPELFSMDMPGGPGMNPLMSLSLAKFLSAPGLWTGLLMSAVFLAAAVRLRRYREPI